MVRKVISAVVVMVVCFGIAMAEEFRAQIIKIDGDKVTFKKIKGKEVSDEEQTLTAAADVKVVKGKFNQDTKKLEAGDPIEGGLKAISEKLGEKGRAATIVTEGKKITEIRVGGRGRKKDQ